MSGVLARRSAQGLFDFLCWLVAVPLAAAFRYDFAPPWSIVRDTLLVGAIMGGFQLVAGWSLHLYRGRYKFGSFDEVRGVVITVALVGGSTTIAFLLVGDGTIPRSTPILASGIALVGMLAGRFLVRGVRESRRATHQGKPTIVLGAGEAGEQLVRAMLLDAAGVYCSTGSACTAGIPRPSAVLTAMGDPDAGSMLRFSLGWTSTRDDVQALAAALPAAVDRAGRAGRL